MPLGLGGVRSWGDTKCMFGLEDTPACGKPGTHHFIFTTSMACTVACDLHARYIRYHNTTMPYDEHAFASDCGMPGSIWIFSKGDTEGHCEFPLDGELELEAVDEVLNGALAGVH